MPLGMIEPRPIAMSRSNGSRNCGPHSQNLMPSGKRGPEESRSILAMTSCGATGVCGPTCSLFQTGSSRRYPTAGSVTICRGRVGSFSSFWRRWPM